MPIPEFDALRQENVLYLTTVGRKTEKPRTIEIWFVSYEERIYLLSRAWTEGAMGTQYSSQSSREDANRTVSFSGSWTHS